MILKTYDTAIRPNYNGVYENLDAYLVGREVLSVDDFKYIEPALETSIKIDAFSHKKYNTNIGNYLMLQQGLSKYYYFITSMEWRANNTVLLNISLDTLNTFPLMLGECHVTRRYKNRYKLDNNYLYPIVDAVPESITTPPMKRTLKERFGLEDKWYLVYKTDYTTADALKDNPVSCYCLPQRAQDVKSETVGDVVISTDKLQDVSICWYSMTYATGEATIDFTNTQGQTGHYSVDDKHWVYFWKENDKITLVQQTLGSGAGTATTSNITEFTVKTGKAYYKQLSSTRLISSVTYDYPIVINAGNPIDRLISFDEWYSTNKTDPTIIKIVELPYSPFTIKGYQQYMLIPDGWELTSNGLKLTTATEFKSFVNSYRPITPISYDTWQKWDSEDKEYDMSLETKMLNSAFNIDKFVYDNNFYAVELEKRLMDKRDFEITVNFYNSTDITNNLAFEFVDNDLYKSGDYSEWLISNRNNELPYYTNEYLNYLRYGKAVDERNVNLQTANAITAGLGSAAGLVASGALTFNAVGAGIGAATGLVTTVINTVTSITKANDTLNAKIDSYTHQASRVNGTSDISIFDKYSGNKLLHIKYEPIPELKKAIARFFSKYGYATDEYMIPTFNNRKTNEYYVLDEINYDGINHTFDNFKDDMESRMKVGFRYYHLLNNDYDFDCKLENFEEKF